MGRHLRIDQPQYVAQMTGYDFLYRIIGSPGAAAAIVAALLTASATAIVGFVVDSRRRHLEFRAIAAAFASDISTTIRLTREAGWHERFCATITKMQRINARNVLQPSVLRPDSFNPHNWPAPDATSLTFPPTVYDHAAERMGLLGADIAADIVEFYNVLNGFRSGVRLALGPGDQPIEDRIAALTEVLRILDEHTPRAEDLGRRLRRLSRRWWLMGRPYQKIVGVWARVWATIRRGGLL